MHRLDELPWLGLGPVAISTVEQGGPGLGGGLSQVDVVPGPLASVTVTFLFFLRLFLVHTQTELRTKWLGGKPNYSVV